MRRLSLCDGAVETLPGSRRDGEAQRVDNLAASGREQAGQIFPGTRASGLGRESQRAPLHVVTSAQPTRACCCVP